jgi:hypothetical protein
MEDLGRLIEAAERGDMSSLDLAAKQSIASIGTELGKDFYTGNVDDEQLWG